mmetsp:Transcript_14796/g.55764  ORF Transcript_14796/g.55764 Transcript_14796/m.55764 type:complete len:240 (+) Transcript_14796:687-1406(+)
MAGGSRARHSASHSGQSSCRRPKKSRGRRACTSLGCAGPDQAGGRLHRASLGAVGRKRRGVIVLSRLQQACPGLPRRVVVAIPRLLGHAGHSVAEGGSEEGEQLGLKRQEPVAVGMHLRPGRLRVLGGQGGVEVTTEDVGERRTPRSGHGLERGGGLAELQAPSVFGQVIDVDARHERAAEGRHRRWRAVDSPHARLWRTGKGGAGGRAGGAEGVGVTGCIFLRTGALADEPVIGAAAS